jgi:hypothetical protein
VRLGIPTIANLLTLYGQVTRHRLPNGEHPMAYVATLPVAYFVPQDVSDKVAHLNGMIRATFPADVVVDFDSWMPADWDVSLMFMDIDGIHLGCGGHARRADVLDVVSGD